MALGAYVADPTDPTKPSDQGVAMGYAFNEIRALKNRINELETTQETLTTEHITDTENPHGVSRTQLQVDQLPNAKSDSVQLEDSEVLATSKAVFDLNAIVTDMLQNRIFPVGSYYITENAGNPATLLGFTSTWTRLPAGYAIVSREPTDNLSPYFNVGAQGGNFTKTLAVGEIPAHNHPATTTLTKTRNLREAGSTLSADRFAEGGDAESNYSSAPTSIDPASTLTASTTTDNTGGGNAFSLMQPYRVTNIWRRIA